jgi:hypothetical protein
LRKVGRELVDLDAEERLDGADHIDLLRNDDADDEARFRSGVGTLSDAGDARSVVLRRTGHVEVDDEADGVDVVVEGAGEGVVADEDALRGLTGTRRGLRAEFGRDLLAGRLSHVVVL